MVETQETRAREGQAQLPSFSKQLIAMGPDPGCGWNRAGSGGSLADGAERRCSSGKFHRLSAELDLWPRGEAQARPNPPRAASPTQPPANEAPRAETRSPPPLRHPRPRVCTRCALEASAGMWSILTRPHARPPVAAQSQADFWVTGPGRQDQLFCRGLWQS